MITPTHCATNHYNPLHGLNPRPIKRAHPLKKGQFSVQNNATLNQIQASRGVLHHKQSNIFFEVDKDRIRPLPTPGSSLKLMGSIRSEDGQERNILAITGVGPYYFSIAGRQLGPADAGSMVSFVVPFNRLDGEGVTHTLNVIM